MTDTNAALGRVGDELAKIMGGAPAARRAPPSARRACAVSHALDDRDLGSHAFKREDRSPIGARGYDVSRNQGRSGGREGRAFSAQDRAPARPAAPAVAHPRTEKPTRNAGASSSNRASGQRGVAVPRSDRGSGRPMAWIRSGRDLWASVRPFARGFAVLTAVAIIVL